MAFAFGQKPRFDKRLYHFVHLNVPHTLTAIPNTVKGVCCEPKATCAEPWSLSFFLINCWSSVVASVVSKFTSATPHEVN